MRAWVLAGVATFLPSVSCAAGSRSSGNFVTPSDGGVTTPESGSNPDSSMGFVVPEGGDASPASTQGCSAAATNFVYVLSSANILYSFAPAQKSFTQIGPLVCATSLTPNSMAVDRNAVAWVNYIGGTGADGTQTGALYRVSTRDASCLGEVTPTLNAPWDRLGMGFSVSGPGSTDDTLYADAASAGILGSIDSTGTVTSIGPFDGVGTGQEAELTGTGDGRLYAFFATTPSVLTQIDKTSGALVSPQTLPSVETPSSFAFSFWGGSFYLYTWVFGQASTNVNKYDPSTGNVDTAYMTDIGFVIVGAGVSTCAPVQAVQ
jgi:hypothetical protein